jgi:ribose transport system permease protein
VTEATKTSLDSAPSIAPNARRPRRVPFGLSRVLLTRQGSMTVVAALMFVVFAFWAPHFTDRQNLIEIARQMSFVTIAAVGMTYLFIVGEFDLSVGAVLSLSEVMMGWLIKVHGLNAWTAAIAVLGIGVAIGLLNGGVSAIFGVPSLVVTLGSLSLLSGIALVITGEFPIDLGSSPNSSLYPLVAGSIGTGVNGIPVEIFWMIAIGLIGAVVLRTSRFGYNVFSTGGNEKAARAMGINTKRVKIFCFIIVAVLTSFVGIIEVSWLKNASPISGTNFLFAVMGAVILGGISVTGGEGSIYGAFVGAFILATLLDGLVLIGVNGDYNQVLIGAIIIVAGLMDVCVRRYNSTAGMRAWFRRRTRSVPVADLSSGRAAPPVEASAASDAETDLR